MEFDSQHVWYHGSPHQLTILRQGSTITQKQELARIFSHKPTVVSVADDGQIKHNGTKPGFLYIIVDDVLPSDVVPHPHTTMGAGDEWLTTRELQLHLLCSTEIIVSEQLTDGELSELYKRVLRRDKGMVNGEPEK